MTEFAPAGEIFNNIPHPSRATFEEPVMRSLLYSPSVGIVGSVGLLLLRLVMGVAFIFHGWPKIQEPMSWMTPFAGDAAPPAILQACAAVAEFVGGGALVFGFLTRLASLGLIATMATAVQFHMDKGHPFVPGPGEQGSYELAAVYLVCSILLLLQGAGCFSLDALMFRKRAP
jgi:putative oxidoreductase